MQNYTSLNLLEDSYTPNINQFYILTSGGGFRVLQIRPWNVNKGWNKRGILSVASGIQAIEGTVIIT